MCLYGAKCCFEVHVMCLHGSDVVRLYGEGARRVGGGGGCDGLGGMGWGGGGRGGLDWAGWEGLVFLVHGVLLLDPYLVVQVSPCPVISQRTLLSTRIQNGFPCLQRLE